MKKIRVGWDDLKPGDLIHVKGSTNTYKFVSYGSETVLGDPEKITSKKAKQYAFVDLQAAAVHSCGRCFYTELKLVVLDSDFDYATRPAPKKPRIEEPVSPGEYWARIRMGSETVWGRIIKRYAPHSDSWLFRPDDKALYQASWCGTLAGLHPWMTWEELLQANKQTPILELLSAEEYYTRKAKGQL
ncbi:MAG: hypothetical protein E7G06_06945 [Bifidobacterium longum]|uniref:hypothetical protein n=1 Tax=Bifidobacterium longum TaxID=216816 RepID=UPI00103AC5DE|nr:hypothetical protein [Bifidobacterium longum]MDU3638974.1 hypothetical protein [Bifidobacterium longum]TCF58458.1 hypothetical protein MCC10114_1997 [Bifidobacterium longum subsp. longum]